jgi:hypothetical protein
MKKYILTTLLVLIIVSIGMPQTNFIRHEPRIEADTLYAIRPLLRQHSEYKVYGTIPDTFKVRNGGYSDTTMAYEVWKNNILMCKVVGKDSIRIIAKGGYVSGLNNYVVPLCTLDCFQTVKDTTRLIWVLPDLIGIKDLFFILQPYPNPVVTDSMTIQDGYISRDRY